MGIFDSLFKKRKVVKTEGVNEKALGNIELNNNEESKKVKLDMKIKVVEETAANLEKTELRKAKQRDRMMKKVHSEAKDEIAYAKSRKDYLEEYEYFLELLETKDDVEKIAARVKKPVVGLYCIQAPLEIFDAYDVHPLKITGGSYLSQRVSASNLPILMCPMLKSLLGSLELYENNDKYLATIVPTTCDWMVKLPELAKTKFKDLYYMELPHIKDSEKGRNTWFREIEDLKEFLKEKSGNNINRKTLENSITKYTETWSVVQELIELKRTRKITSFWQILITNSFLLDDVIVWTQNVKKVISKIKEQNEFKTGAEIIDDFAVFIAGSPIVFPNMKMNKLMEQAEMINIADDLCSSERIFPGGVIYDDPSIEGMTRALAERYHTACICPCFADNEYRVNNIIKIARKYKVKGVIFHVLKGCHLYDVESITIEKELRDEGLKFIKIETDYVEEDKQNILTRLEAFKQTL